MSLIGTIACIALLASLTFFLMIVVGEGLNRLFHPATRQTEAALITIKRRDVRRMSHLPRH